MDNVINIYTDGSCNNKLPVDQRFGGWAFVISWKGKIDKLCVSGGVRKNTSSQRMEMQAVLKALEYVSEIEIGGLVIKIHSDSAYVVNCFKDKWYEAWEECDYLFVKNEDLWKKILTLYRFLNRSHKVEFVKVKGHSGVECNEMADHLAREERKKLTNS